MTISSNKYSWKKNSALFRNKLIVTQKYEIIYCVLILVLRNTVEIIVLTWINPIWHKIHSFIRYKIEKEGINNLKMYIGIEI